MSTPTGAMDPLAGTSAVQHAPTDNTLLNKQPAPGAATDAPNSPISISGNISSIFWARRRLTTNGFGARSFSFPPPVVVRSDSQVSVSITELDSNGKPHHGLAAMLVYNVIPFDDSTIIVRYHVDWGEPLNVMFNFIIVN